MAMARKKWLPLISNSIQTAGSTSPVTVWAARLQSLVAERLVEKGVPKAQVPVITFGAPAVGNKAFADVYGKRIDLIRVVTSLDPVPGSLQTFWR